MIKRWVIQSQKTFGKINKNHNRYDIDILPRITIHKSLKYDMDIEFSINFHWLIYQVQIYFLLQNNH